MSDEVPSQAEIDNDVTERGSAPVFKNTAELRAAVFLAHEVGNALFKMPDIAAWAEGAINAPRTRTWSGKVGLEAREICRSHNLPSRYLAYMVAQAVRFHGGVGSEGIVLQFTPDPFDFTDVDIRSRVTAELQQVLELALADIKSNGAEMLSGPSFFPFILQWCERLNTHLKMHVKRIQDQTDLPPERDRKDLSLRAKALILNRLGDGASAPIPKERLPHIVLPRRDFLSARRTIYKWIGEAERLLGLKPPTL